MCGEGIRGAGGRGRVGAQLIAVLGWRGRRRGRVEAKDHQGGSQGAEGVRSVGDGRSNEH